MTDKQSDALRLADELEDSLESHDGSSLTARCQGIADDAAAELRRQYAEIETLRAGYAAARLEIESLRGRGVEPAGEYPALPGRTIDELTESQRESAIAAYRAAHEQDPDFGFAPDRAWVEGAAYVDALAAGQATVAQQGMTYAELPDAPLPVFSKGPWTFKETGQSFSGAELDEAAFVAYRDRASNGQAPASTSCDFIRRTNEDYAAWCATKYTPEFNSKGPDLHGLWAWQEQQRRMDDLLRQAPAQATPTYKDSTPELHIGDSAFESWYSSYNPMHKGDKQRARDAYAAGMGDSLVTAAPAAVTGPSGYGPKVTVKRRCSDCKACNSESYAVQGDSGHYVYCEHPSLPESKYIGDTHWDTPDWCPAAAPTTQPAPKQEAQAGSAQGDALDAERYRWLRIQDSEDFEFAVVKNPHFDVFESPEELDFAIDAARAAQEGKTNE